MNKDLDIQIVEALRAYLTSGSRIRWTIRSSTSTPSSPVYRIPSHNTLMNNYYERARYTPIERFG